MIFNSNTEEQTISIANERLISLDEKTVVLLIGDLGAGKTVFVKGLAQGYNDCKEDVTSPTFVVSNEYEKDDKRLLHLDLYRMKSGEFDQELLGIIEESNSPIVIEWPDRIGENLMEYINSKKKIINVHIEITEEGREIVIN